jgi:hypothetical protein
MKKKTRKKPEKIDKSSFVTTKLTRQILNKHHSLSLTQMVNAALVAFDGLDNGEKMKALQKAYSTEK